VTDLPLPWFGPGLDPGPSFSALLQRSAPELMPTPVDGDASQLAVPHGTTIVCMRHTEGVLMAGDRRATEGYSIASRGIVKVFAADNWSGVSIAGAAGPAVEMVRLFQTELEHYEKVEGVPLALEGKANKLSQMIRANLPMAMQGLAVVPLFAGYDLDRHVGRLFRFDVTGGRYEESEFHATGSGGVHARNFVKTRWHPGVDLDAAIDMALEALFQAADEDVATGGPDPVRGIYPVVATIESSGFRFIPEDDLAERTGRVIARVPRGGADR
jgi:proteasome beta subunit